jgi:hypothetical protein
MSILTVRELEFLASLRNCWGRLYLSESRASRMRTTMRGRPTKDPDTRPAINTLERLHIKLGGQILENRQRHEELSGQMRHVEAVIKMLDPAYNLARITVKRRQPNKWFGTLYWRHWTCLGRTRGR